MNKEYFSKDPEETHRIAGKIASGLQPDCVLALSGDLGTGKTTFVSGLAQELGIEQSITSPTFNIYHLYEGRWLLAHCDAYRLENAGQLEEVMLWDFLVSPYCLAIEWPEHVRECLPENSLWLYFDILDPGHHRIRVLG